MTLGNIKPPSFDDIKAVFEHIESLDLRMTEVQYIIEKLRLTLMAHRISIQIESPGRTVFRIRVVKSLGDCNSTEDITYPKPNFVMNFQRANRPNRPMFYCSNSVITPFFEVSLEVGSLVVLSKWITKEVLPIKRVAYNIDYLKHLGSDRSSVNIVDETEQNNFISNRLSMMFIQNVSSGHEYIYKPSVAVTEVFMQPIKLKAPLSKNGYLPDHIPAVLYPSVAMWGNGDNLAIIPTYVDQYMELIQIDLLKVLEKREKSFKVVTVDHGSISGPTINWVGVPRMAMRTNGEPAIGSVTLQAREGGWISFDQDGKDTTMF
jgi:hypothetical protein